MMDERIPRDPGEDRGEVFAGLYATHYRPLVALCRRLSASADSEGLAQEAFLRAWTSWDRYAPNRPFWPWVSTIARRLCIDQGRRLRTAQARGPYATDGLRSEPSVEEWAELREEYRWARAALEQLRPDQRRVISLRDLEGWSYDRIADHEGVTVESVRGSLRRARSQLRLVYARISSASPVIVVLALLRDIRRRIADWSHRVQSSTASAGVVGVRAAESIAAVVMLAVGGISASLPATAPPHAVAAPRGASGVVTPTATTDRSPVTTTSVATHAGGAMASGGHPSDAAGSRGRGGAAGALEGLQDVPGRGGTTPESATFMSFTASPNYQHDHEIYASGTSIENCLALCPALFRSTDAGQHWTRLPAVAFDGGTVMLPPSYPADSRIFIGGPNALEVSSDRGTSFTPLTPAGGFTAMSPAFSAGDSRILVGAIPGWIYHDGTKAVTPFDAVPESASTGLSFAFAPAYPRDHRIVVGGTDTSPNQKAIVSACDVSNCTAPTVLAGSTGTPAVMTSRSYSVSGLTFAWTPVGLYRSTDGAASFSSLRMPAPGTVKALAEGADGTLYMGLLSNGPAGANGGLFASHDAGTTWSRLGAGSVLDHGVLSVIALPSGNILVGPYGPLGGGLQCSSDNGRTWGPRCS
jgi:RNA polymerase sigma-70 factor (ECF subfamily)